MFGCSRQEVPSSPKIMQCDHVPPHEIELRFQQDAQVSCHDSMTFYFVFPKDGSSPTVFFFSVCTVCFSVKTFEISHYLLDGPSLTFEVFLRQHI